MSSRTQIRFEAAGYLADPQVGSPSNIFRPYGDTVALLLKTEAGDELAYILNRASKRQADTSTPHYREVLLDPSLGIYRRNLYEDFCTIPGFIANSPVTLIERQIADVGWTTLDDLYIGIKPPDEPPSATLGKPAAATNGARTCYFKVNYVDDTKVDVASLDRDILVSGPNGFRQNANLYAKSRSVNAAKIVATYSFRAPGGTWDSSDNGTYTFTLRAGEVKDIKGNVAAKQKLGALKVSLAAPSATASSSVRPQQKLFDIDGSALVSDIADLL